uniref:Cytochrome b5 heme-binding domain-containing protein n=1 Tax=Anopheles dirus TaxID=7168 RepID=A0A182N698_9DIPT
TQSSPPTLVRSPHHTTTTQSSLRVVGQPARAALVTSAFLRHLRVQSAQQLFACSPRKAQYPYSPSLKTMAPTELKQYSLAEVAQHNKPDDVWMVIHDKVYDVTKFLSEHPGGEEVLVEYAGKEATAEFDDVGHSSDAKEQMKQFLVGELIEADRKAKAGAGMTKCQRTALIAGSAMAIGAGLAMIFKANSRKIGEIIRKQEQQAATGGIDELDPPRGLVF